MKTHFASVERANESDNNNYWSKTVCGTESEKVDDDWDVVSCKKCLSQKNEYEKAENEAVEHSCNDMAEFMQFQDSLIKN